MAGQVVQNDDVAWLQRGGELCFDIDLEDLLGHRSIDDPGGGQAVAAQAGDEGLGFPMAKRRASLQAAAALRSAAQPGHFRGCCRLIDEDQPMGRLPHGWLTIEPPSPPCLAHIIAPALRRQQLFFYI